MTYSPPGSPGAVDAAPVHVNAWHSDATVAVSFGGVSKLRQLAVAVDRGAHAAALARIGRSPLSSVAAVELDVVLADRAVAAAWSHTMTFSEAETLRDALTDALTELSTPADDWAEEPR